MAYQKKDYIQSDAVTEAYDKLQGHQATKPSDYTSKWESYLDDVLGQIQNREPFKYDINSDALYNQYKGQYIRQGQMAMQDAMGQASAMTGGYGNSYAQTVGQQTYQNYLQGLNEMVPQFYQMALDKYQMEGDDLMNQYAMMADRENQDYGRWQDAMNQYYNELDRLQGIYDNERSYDYGVWSDQQDFDYGLWRDDVADQQWQSAFEYQQQQNQLAHEQWLQEFEYQKQQDELAYQQWQQEFEYQKQRDAAAAASRSSGGSGGGGGYGYDTHGMSIAEIKELQRELGVTADGIWGPNTEAAYQAAYGGGGGNITFADVGITAENIAATGGDAHAYITAARQAGVISTDQYKSLKYTFGY